MKRMLIVFFCLITFFAVFRAHAQKDQMIRVNGLVIDGESLQNIPFANVTVKNELRTTYTNESGVFSIYAFPEDTLVFSIVGYNSAYLVVPEDVKGDSYSHIQRLYRDTLMLEAFEIGPLPADFGEAFMSLDTLHDPAWVLNQWTDSLYTSRYEQDKFYYEKRYYFIRWDVVRVWDQQKFIPPNHWLEPWRWAGYIKNVKQGYYKGKEPITDQYFYRPTWNNYLD